MKSVKRKVQVVKKPKMKQVRLPPTTMLQVEVPKGTIPVVVQKAGIIEIIPVPKKAEPGWVEYLFGKW